MRRWADHEHRAVTVDDQTKRILFRDDDRQGFALNIFRAPDGDFHLSIAVVNEDADDFDKEYYGGMWAKSIRVRAPFTGGGSHEELYHVLHRLFMQIK